MGKLHEVGKVEVCRIARTSYLQGTPKEDTETWAIEWFYMVDASLYDPVHSGLSGFSSAPPKKRFNWRPRSSSQKDDTEVARLAAQVRCLAHNRLTIIDVTATAISQGVQPPQPRIHPLWRYNGTNDAARSSNHGCHYSRHIQGEKEDFSKRKFIDGFSYYRPVKAVSLFQITSSIRAVYLYF